MNERYDIEEYGIWYDFEHYLKWSAGAPSMAPENRRAARRMAYHCEGYCDQQVALAEASGDTERLQHYQELANHYCNVWLHTVNL